MGWDIDDIIIIRIRNLLKDRYAGCSYSMATSYSPVVIRFRESISIAARKNIVGMFPKNIRVEFQWTDDPVDRTIVYGYNDKMEMQATHPTLMAPPAAPGDLKHMTDAIKAVIAQAESTDTHITDYVDGLKDALRAIISRGNE